MPIDKWSDLVEIAESRLKELKLSPEYQKRLEFELKEIAKQGANGYWTRLYNSNKKFDHNKAGLILPYLLGITNIDPIKGISILYASGDINDPVIDGIEIELEDGNVIITSQYTLIKTTGGFKPAGQLSQDDDLVP